MRCSILLACFLAVACSKGESLATPINLKDPAERTIETQAGDALAFSTAAVIDLSSLPGNQRQREEAAYTALKRTKLTVVVKGPSGEQTATCPIYDGNPASTKINSSLLKANAMTNTCAISLATAGSHTVKATAQFDPMILVHDARLDIRRASAK